MSQTDTILIKLEGEALEVLRLFHKTKQRWYDTDNTDPLADQLYEEVKLLQAKVATWTETLVLQQAPGAIT